MKKSLFKAKSGERMKTNPKVDAFIEKAKAWQAEYARLRTLLLSSGLEEELKWGVPCYSLSGKNVALMHGFKEYCALLFMKGALMKDPKKILIQQTQQVQAARQIRFKNLQDIIRLQGALKAYLREAVAVEKSGAKVELKKTEEFPVAAELKAKWQEVPELKKAFQALTPGRQRAYLLYFSQAKQSATRVARIEKHLKDILAGKGLND